MPIKKSAKKFQKSSQRKHLRNIQVKEKIRGLMKKTRELIINKDSEKASATFKMVQKAIDKASQKKIIKKNSAGRKKKRLFAALKKIKNK